MSEAKEEWIFGSIAFSGGFVVSCMGWGGMGRCGGVWGKDGVLVL